MTATSYGELIARLREATGPDRNFDRDIWEVANRDAFHKAYWFARSSLPKGTPDNEKDARGRAGIRNAPHYTASIDAALTLVPEKLPAHSEIILEIEGDRSAVWARIDVRGDYPGEEKTIADGEHGNSLPIAICIAALLARAALAGAQP